MKVRIMFAVAAFGALGWPALAVELQPLIVGDSMPGWEEKGGAKPAWSVHDGLLVSAGGESGWFGSTAEYTDFIIDFEFKLPPGGDTGVYLRVPKTGRPGLDGLEVQILDDDDVRYKSIPPAQRCGALYGIEPPARQALRPAGQWNHMRVMADSDYLLVELNGQTVVDTDGQAHPEIFKRSPRGPVGFQNRSAGVSFRNLKFADLAADRAGRMRWWNQAKFGMFVHWGIYAVRGEGEWVMNYGRMSTADYEKLAGQFNPTAFDTAEWVGLAKRAGAGYIVITTKHHDGFDMFDSKTSDYDLADRTPYKKDPLKLLADECARQGIRLGFYYSIADWHHPDYRPAPDWDPAVRPAQQRDFGKYLDYLEAQLRELCTNYGPVAVIWYDGAAAHKKPEEKARFSRINRMIRQLQPGVIINDRSNRLEDYATPEQFIPPTGVRHLDGSMPAWESCMTITTGNGSFPHMAWWGYDKNETQFKTPAACIRMLVDVVSKGGNLLLNVGPDATGRIGPNETRAFKAVGEWLKVNGPAIYGTTAGPFKHLPFNGRVTLRGSTMYVHVFDWPKDGRLVIPGLLNQVRSATLLKGQKMEPEAQAREIASITASREGDDWVIHLPATTPDEVVSVVALELDGPPKLKPYAIRPDAGGRIVLEAIDAHMPLDPGLHFRLEESGGQVHIGRWVSMQDVATWQVTAAQKIDYDVMVEYAAEPGKPAGAFEFELTSAGGTSTKLQRDIEPTGAPDRFQTRLLGRCTVPAGAVTISIRPLRLPKNVYLMNLRQVNLIPRDEKATRQPSR